MKPNSVAPATPERKGIGTEQGKDCVWVRGCVGAWGNFAESAIKAFTFKTDYSIILITR